MGVTHPITSVASQKSMGNAHGNRKIHTLTSPRGHPHTHAKKSHIHTRIPKLSSAGGSHCTGVAAKYHNSDSAGWAAVEFMNMISVRS